MNKADNKAFLHGILLIVLFAFTAFYVAEFDFVKRLSLSPLIVGIILGMIYNFLPFMVLPIYNSLVKIPQDTFDAAKDLGANWGQTLWHITLPQILPGIVSGITMVFVPSMTTFVISNLLGGAKINLIGNVIEQEFTTANNWYGGAGLSIVLMILILGSMAIMSHFDKDGEGAAIW